MGKSQERKYYDYCESNIKRAFHGLSATIVTLVLIVLTILCNGCKSQPCLPIPSSGTHDHDSVRTEYVHDSISVDRWHTIYAKGDTVYVRDSIYFYKWRNKHDSIYINNTDTIYQTVQVEKQGSAFLRNSGIALWVLIGLLVVAAIIGIILKFAK